MKNKRFMMPLLCAVFSASFAQAQPVSLATDQEKLSYAIGMMAAKTFREQQITVDLPQFIEGFSDVMNDSPLQLTETQARELLQRLEGEQQQSNGAALDQLAQDNLRMGQEFLAKNKQQPNVVTLKSGLQYKVLVKGKGQSPKADQSVTVNYEGKTINGNVFDSSYSRGKPTTFVVDQVIKGWQQALQLMQPGAVWELYIPADLAYGNHNVPNIGPNQVLIFKVELISVE